MLFALHYLTATPTGASRFISASGAWHRASLRLSASRSATASAVSCASVATAACRWPAGSSSAAREPASHRVRRLQRRSLQHGYDGYRYTFGREAAWSTPVVDFVKWAEAIGARGRRLKGEEVVTADLLRELTVDGPAVLRIWQNAETRIQGDGRIEAIRQMSMIHEEM